MRYFCLIFMLLLLSNHPSWGNNLINFEKTKLPDTVIKGLKSNKIYSQSVVEDFKDKNNNRLQELKFTISGLHQKKCSPVLRKLSVYENYPKYMDFVKQAHYEEANQRIYLALSSSILPMKMILYFKIPRIKKIGNYPFYFDKGFLTGLAGIIQVNEIDNRCFFYTTAYWKGKHSKFPNFLFEFFSSTLTKLAMQNLFRISQTL